MDLGEEGVEEAFDLIQEVSERVYSGLWVGDCFIYNNSAWRLNYVVGSEVTTVFHLDKAMYLLSYTILLSMIEYKTLVMRDDMEGAAEILPNIPQEHMDSVAQFLENRGFVQEALDIATDPEYRFELAMQLGDLQTCLAIAAEVDSQMKWKTIGDL